MIELHLRENKMPNRTAEQKRKNARRLRRLRQQEEQRKAENMGIINARNKHLIIKVINRDRN